MGHPLEELEPRARDVRRQLAAGLDRAALVQVPDHHQGRDVDLSQAVHGRRLERLRGGVLLPVIAVALFNPFVHAIPDGGRASVRRLARTVDPEGRLRVDDPAPVPRFVPMVVLVPERLFVGGGRRLEAAQAGGHRNERGHALRVIEGEVDGD